MKRHKELGLNMAEISPTQSLRKDINWATKKTLAVDNISSGSLINILKKSAVVLAGKTTEGREDVAVVLPQISTNDPERADEVRVASVAIQKEAIHKAAQQRLISLEAAEEKLQGIDDGIEPRPRVIFQKTPGLMRAESKKARIVREISRERQETSKAGGSSEAQASNAWQIPAKRERRIKRKNIIMVATIPFIAVGCSKVVMTPIPTENRPAPTEFIEPTEPIVPTEPVPLTKETQIAPSPAQESMENILLTSVEVMTEEEIQADPLLSDPNFQEGINNYVQETREVRELSEESTSFELVVIRGTTTEGDEMLFPFATWTAQNQEGLTFVDMIGAAEEGLVMITLEHQEIEKDGILYYALVLQGLGPIFAIPASEIDNPEAEISFSPSGKAIESTELMIGSKVLFALKPEIESTELTQEEINELADKLLCSTNCIFEAYQLYPEHEFGLRLISSGKFVKIEIKDPATKELVGYVDALVAVTKDAEGKPFVIHYAVQSYTLENPMVNGLRAGISDAAEKKGLIGKITSLADFIVEPQPEEFLEELYPKGEMINRISPLDMTGQWDGWNSEILNYVFGDPAYRQAIADFARGNVDKIEKPLLIFPA